MSLDDLYKDIILDHYQHPRNRGALEDPDVAVRGHNPLCGDEVLLSAAIRDGKIADIGTAGRGCSISQATSSMMTESVKGGTLEEARRLAGEFKTLMTGDAASVDLSANSDLEALQGVKRFPVRVKCALLPWTALLEALDTWESSPRGKQEAAATS
ncbi:MAG: SUF system NifU family Fe-S cluster assembly protein [Chloroflexota bacterium]